MAAPPRAAGTRRRVAPTPPMPVVALDARRIQRALEGRSRYRYVLPSLHAVAAAEGGGWIVRSPNCSRNISPTGGEIPIAWFQPGNGASWRLHAFDHAAGAWVLQSDDLPLSQALALVCADSNRLYWP